MLNQYNNPLNAEAHFCTTGPEIWNTLGEEISAFVCAGSTGGTISGVGRFLKSRKSDCQVVLLDPVGSIYHKYFHEGSVDPNVIAPYKVEGVGEDHLAQCLDFSIVDDVLQFSVDQAFENGETHCAEKVCLRRQFGAIVWAAYSSPANSESCDIVTVLRIVASSHVHDIPPLASVRGLYKSAMTLEPYPIHGSLVTTPVDIRGPVRRGSSSIDDRITPLCLRSDWR